MRKFSKIILIAFFSVFCFGFFVSAQAPLPCENITCEGVNSVVPCDCGGATADSDNPYCCNGAIYDSLENCCSSCADADSDGNDAIVCGGKDCDDDNICIYPLSIEKEGIVLPDGCPHNNEGTLTCEDGVDNDCDGLADRCHDPDCDCAGGIIPCGRNADDPTTNILENSPCSLCHIFILVKKIIDLSLLYAVFPLIVLLLAIAGLFFIISGGDPQKISKAKSILKGIGIGIIITFFSWLAIELIIMMIVPSSAPWKDWSTISCPVPPCDNDDNCETDKGEDAQNCPTDCPYCDFDGICDPVEEIGGGLPESCIDCSECGDGVVDVGEFCDGAVIRGITATSDNCKIYGFSSGRLACTDDCQIDLSACSSGAPILVPGALSASITSPFNGQSFLSGAGIPFAGIVSGGTVPYSYSWNSDIDGPIGSLLTFSINTLSVGSHRITFTVRDSLGNTVTDSIRIDIL